MKLQPSGHPDYKKVRVEKVIDEAPDVKTFVLAADAGVEYKAGQFLTFVFEDVYGEERRSYSFSSAPGVDKQPAFTIKRVPNGKYSRPLIDSLNVGDVLAITGAAGQFILPENISEYTQVFFFAAGVGITPVISLIKELLFRYSQQEAILIYSNAAMEQAVFYNQLLALHTSFPKRFRLEFLFSSSANLGRARLSKWLLPQLLSSYSNGQKTRHLFYTCGPFAYMRMVLITLEELGYRGEQVKKEIFDTSRPVTRIAPPDLLAHKVVLRLKHKTEEINVQYPQTILAAAKELGVMLPYSCETGKCGSCLMHCISGKVWMSHNEVLTDRDIASGKVLTCVGYPVYGDVVLE